MSIQRVPVESVLHQLTQYDSIIDTRSEDEYALDHLPGAVNWPTLHNDERVRVGTLHQQESGFHARKLGATMAARNIAGHLEREMAARERDWKPLAYCWRGGQRSGALALILDQIGFRVHVLAGGYKAFRKALLTDLPVQAGRLRYQVLCGPTGSGKTRLLHALAQVGAQVLDLEALASHRASVLGAIPGQPQPGQKRFETLLWDALRSLDPSRPVFVEAESRKVGDLTLPEALIGAIRASPCLRLDLALAKRVQLLLDDYAFFGHDPEGLCERLGALVELRGKATVQRWQELARSGGTAQLVRELLEQHYDPGYARSTRRNFTAFGSATPIPLRAGSVAEMRTVAERLLRDS